MSPDCAAVVMASSGALGAGAAFVLTPLVLSMAGFSAVGPAAGSWAAAWQSTMPLVAQGSLFASLQSTAMAGVGATTLISGSALGGATGVALLTRICSAVDHARPGSTEQQAVKLVRAAVRGAERITSAALAAGTPVAAALYKSGLLPASARLHSRHSAQRCSQALRNLCRVGAAAEGAPGSAAADVDAGREDAPRSARARKLFARLCAPPHVCCAQQRSLPSRRATHLEEALRLAQR